MERKPLVVVMGVSGAGKTVVGRAIAARLHLPYADGDDFHSAANVSKMHAGHALDDADRAPWLEAVGEWLAQHEQEGGVASCSALRRSYRDALREHAPRALFVQLNADAKVLRTRIDGRSDHFMPSTLLDSQLRTLEPLAADEHGVVLDNQGQTPEQLAAAFATKI